MKKCCFILLNMLFCFGALFLSSCSKEKPSMELSLLDTDSTQTQTDSLENVIEEMPMPVVADELFDDFVFNFAANRRLQLKRIAFPLDVEKGGQTTQVTKKEWNMDHLFMNDGFYTVLLDNAKQLEVTADTTVNRVTVEKIYLGSHAVRNYCFERRKGLWMLTKITEEDFNANANGAFLEFYKHFSTDTVFQAQSMAADVTFTAPDPDNELEDVTGTMMPEQWSDFKPEVIPAGTIYNIDYGNTQHSDQHKTMFVCGIANGLETTLTFSKKSGQWKLTGFTY